MKKLTALEMHRLSVEQFRQAEKLPLVVVLDNVRSLYNVGSVFRSGDAFRVAGLCLCGITACPPHPEIHKTALGGEDSVAWRYFSDTLEAVAELHRQGYFVWSVEQVVGSTKLQHLSDALNAQQRTDAPNNQHLGDALNAQQRSDGTAYAGQALILGNEVKGVQQSVVDQSDGCLEIPQFGTKHSLNVSTTAGIVIWEFAKQFLTDDPAPAPNASSPLSRALTY